MSVSARPFRANTFFAQPWAENSHFAGRREPIMARLQRAGSMLSRGKWSMRRRGGATESRVRSKYLFGRMIFSEKSATFRDHACSVA
jgi:hypothetical protein